MQENEPLSRGWRRGAIKDGQVAHGLSYYYYGETRRLSRRLLSGDSATIIDGGEERRAAAMTTLPGEDQHQRLHRGFSDSRR